MLGLCERLRGGQGVTGCGIRLCFFLSLGRGINILSSGRGVCLEKMDVDFYQFSSFPWYCPFLSWIYKDSKSIPKSRFLLIIIAAKWQIERSAALWISGIYSYLLCSNMIKAIGDVPSMWLDGTDNSKFSWMWVWIITWCKEKLQLWVVAMLFLFCCWLHLPALALHHVSFQALSLPGSVCNKCTFIFWVLWNWES